MMAVINGGDAAMPIEVARHAGFCMGVNHCGRLRGAGGRGGKSLGIPCYSLGELIPIPLWLPL